MDNDHQLALALLKLGALAAPLLVLLFLLKIIMATEKTLGKFGKSLQDGLSRAGNRGAGLATRAAKNSVPGMQVQQLLGERRASRVRTAQDRNQRLIGGTGGWSNAVRRAVAGNDPARQQAFLEQTRNAYQDRTQKSMQGKNPIAIGDLAQFDRGETVDHYVARNADIQAGLSHRAAVQAGTASERDTRDYNNAVQRVAALNEMHQQFGDQLGTDEFREAALRGAVSAGSNPQDVIKGMQRYVEQYRGGDADLAQSLGRVAQDAKAAGFSEFSAVGYQGTQAQGNRNFNQYQIKDAGAVLRNMDLTKQETGQFIVGSAESATARDAVRPAGAPHVAAGDRTALGQAIYDRLTHPTDESVRQAMLRDLSMARRSKPFQGEYLAIVRQADAAAGLTVNDPTSLEAQLNDMISRV